MEFAILVLLAICVALIFIKLYEIQKQVKSNQLQLDQLCMASENQQLASNFISAEDKAQIAYLKNSGEEVKAVKKVRELTAMDLVQAKQYVDRL